jgi:hypothetical protein
MWARRLQAVALALGAGVALGACGTAATGSAGRLTTARAQRPARWATLSHASRPLDIVGPRADGALVLAAAGRLFLLTAAGVISPYPGPYRSPGGEEPYVALARAGRAGCSFGRDSVYAIRLAGPRGVVAIDSSGRVRRFATLSAPGLIDGIAFDDTGRFGHRLLVTINAGARSTVDAVDCRGAVSAITGGAPRVEGGIVIAPAGFGRFGGDLIASGEASGQIFAISPQGRSRLLADSGLPHGNDIGVESEAFVPTGRAVAALVADRLTPGNPHPGDDVVLKLGAPALAAAGVRAGDLLVATEGGALTDAVSCSSAGCRVRYVANGPAVAHLEGHIAFAP